LVWFHGGGLESGDRRIDEAFARFVTDRGCALVSVEYRLAPKAQHPMWLEDGAAAIQWTLARLRKVQAGDATLFISGHSAGAYVAAMLGLDARWLGALSIPLTRIAGLIPISGQMTTHYRIRMQRGLDNSIQPTIDEAAPLFHAAKNSAPFLSFTGSQDVPLRSSENRYLDDILSAHGHTDHAFHEIEGRDHCSIVAGFTDADDVVTRLMWGFMDRLGQKSQQAQAHSP
jgi:acetyl esterase/lipase